GRDEGEEPAEEVPGGQQARQQEDAAAPLLTELLPAPPPRAARAFTRHMPAPHDLSTPITVSPPLTRSPSLTRISVPRATTRSVRDPNRISPSPPPAWSLPPGRTGHTMRRASPPAIGRPPPRPASVSSAPVQRSLASDPSGG